MKLIDLSDRHNMFYWQTNRRITPQQQKEIFLDRHQEVNNSETIAAIEYGMQQAGYNKNEIKVVVLEGPAKHGSVNSVINAKLKNGMHVVIRMHPHNVKNGYFWAEKVAAQKAKDIGVPAFKTYFINDAHTKFSFDFMLMEALPGITMKDYLLKHSVDEQTLVEETGKFVAKIHQIKTIGFGFFLNDIAKKDSRLQGQYNDFSEHIYAALKEDLDFLVTYEALDSQQREKIEKIFIKRKSYMNFKSPVLIHNDVADWNELANNGHVSGILDWDECCSGDPMLDFACYSLFFDDQRMNWFKLGYEKESELPNDFEEKLHLYRLRYLVSKLHLRKKRLIVSDSLFIKELLERGLKVMKDEFNYFKF